MKKPQRGAIDAIRRDVSSVRGALVRTMRRPGTYPGFARELVLAGMNLAFYPAGLLSDVLKVEDEVSLGDRYTSQIPLRYLDPEAASTPIVLLHGYFHNRSAFLVMRRALKRFGYRSVTTMNYNVIGHDVPKLAAELAEHVDDVLAQVEGTRVHLVGHSLGGLVARYYIQEMGGHEKVHTCITLGTPHQGTYAAFAGRGKAARQLRPGSPLIRQLGRSARKTPVRFVSYYSNLDSLVLPSSNGKLTEPALRATNIMVKDLGHLGLLMSRPVIRSILETLSSLDNPGADVRALHRPDRTARRRARAQGA